MGVRTPKLHKEGKNVTHARKYTAFQYLTVTQTPLSEILYPPLTTMFFENITTVRI